MRVLISIANHGNSNRFYLEQLIDTYRQMPIDISIVILSNIPKDIGHDVEVRVGVPSKNPWSLPFAHRTLFRERLEEYDYFIYSEDDTLMRWHTLEAFFKADGYLPCNEIAGFLRTEQGKDGKIYFSSCHNFFRWIPNSVRTRGNKIWARYSNQHSACFAARREHVRMAIGSGGFSTEPHEGRFDMLCSAATDIYTRCGLERLICIDQVEDFTLPHLPNKYVGIMGLPEEEVYWQIDALRKIHSGFLSSHELFDPETRLPGSYGSKRLHEEPDPLMLHMLEGNDKNILIWGAGDGNFEVSFQKSGRNVYVYPFNSIMGECCYRRGLIVLPFSENRFTTDGRKFDAVVLRDVLHLLDNPEEVLGEVRRLLRSGGKLLIRVPNFYTLRMFYMGISDSKYRYKFSKNKIGITVFTVNSLKRLVKEAGFDHIIFKPSILQRFQNINHFTFGLFEPLLTRGIYLRAIIN